MAIKQRFTRPVRLRYHTLFGSVTALPLGLRDRERAYGVPEYERELAEVRRIYPKLTEGQAKGRVLAGIDTGNVIGDANLKAIAFPLDRIEGGFVPGTRDPLYAYQAPLDRVLIGFTYDRFEGMGRGDCFGAWGITRQGYLAHGTPGLHHTYYDGERHEMHTQQHPLRVMGINLFEDHTYLGEFPSVAGETAAVHRGMDAVKAVVKFYEKQFDVRIKWYGRR